MAGKSKYDEFFAVIVKDDTVYKCPHPECTFTYIRTKGKSPGELRTHLRTKHPADFARLEQKERADKENRGGDGEKPKAEKKKKANSGNEVRIKADPDAPRHSAPAQLPPPPPPLPPTGAETPRSNSPPTSAFHTPLGERTNAASSGGVGGVEGRQRAPKRRHSGDMSPISSTPMPDFFNSSLGSEVRAFSQYIGQRLDLLPRQKRRTVELKVMMMLNEVEEAGEAPSTALMPSQLVEQPIASTSTAPPLPMVEEESPAEAEAAEAPRMPLQPSGVENFLMNIN